MYSKRFRDDDDREWLLWHNSDFSGFVRVIPPDQNVAPLNIPGRLFIDVGLQALEGAIIDVIEQGDFTQEVLRRLKKEAG